MNDNQKVSDIRYELENYLARGNEGKFYWAEKLLTKEAWWPNRHMYLQIVSPFVHWLTSHYFYEDLCSAQFTNFTEAQLDMCATTYQFFKLHDDFDRIMDFDRSFFGYPDDRTQSEPLWLLRRIGRSITYIGMFFYLLEI